MPKQTRINRFNDQILQLANILDVQLLQQIGVRNAFGANGHCDDGQVFQLLCHHIGQLDERAFIVQILFVCTVRKQIQRVQVVCIRCARQLSKNWQKMELAQIERIITSDQSNGDQMRRTSTMFGWANSSANT